MFTVTPPPIGYRLVELDTLRSLYSAIERQWRAAAADYDDLVHRRRAGEPISTADIDAAWEHYLDAIGQRKGLDAFLDAAELKIDVLL
jgi:hypothetical protein